MGGWTVKDLSELVEARTGDGGVWEYSGELVALGSGRVLAKVRGIEEIIQDTPVHGIGPRSDLNKPSSRALAGSPPRESAPSITHASRLVTRKSLFYVDPVSDEKMDVFRYRPTAPPRPVFPILSPAAILHIALDAKTNLVFSRGVVGQDTRLNVQAPPLRPLTGLMSAAWTYIGRSAALTSAKTPNKPGVVEEYHFVLGRNGGAGTWVRYGKCPSWYSGGQCMMNLRSIRVKNGRRGLDEKLRSWLSSVDRQDSLKVKDATRALAEQAENRPPPRAKFLGIL